ncbi:MAG: 50S ribosomal protein L10 [Proteobacteria bacterium]|nr:MAG: 50S ribosomal protein L10 [Pseudomonadota bacterium]
MVERAEKEKQVKEISECLSKAQVAICADYRGLTVAEVTALRRELKKSQATGSVVKNTLARISAKQVYGDAPQADLEKFLELFEGPSLLIYSLKDPVTPAKVVADFIKDKKKLTLKGGWMEGAFMGPEQVDSLAKMPGKQEIFARLLNVLIQPAQQLMRVMQEPGAQVARVLNAHATKSESAGS